MGDAFKNIVDKLESQGLLLRLPKTSDEDIFECDRKTFRVTGCIVGLTGRGTPSYYREIIYQMIRAKKRAIADIEKDFSSAHGDNSCDS